MLAAYPGAQIAQLLQKQAAVRNVMMTSEDGRLAAACTIELIQCHARISERANSLNMLLGAVAAVLAPLRAFLLAIEPRRCHRTPTSLASRTRCCGLRIPSRRAFGTQHFQTRELPERIRSDMHVQDIIVSTWNSFDVVHR
jgi:hypothetical protein